MRAQEKSSQTRDTLAANSTIRTTDSAASIETTSTSEKECNQIEPRRRCFSDRWSHAKEDSKRKLYSKRNKVQVRFVEIDDAVPIHSPSSQLKKTYFGAICFQLQRAH